MTPYEFTLLLFGPLVGAAALSLTRRERSPILYDRLVTAGIGALAGLVVALVVIGVWLAGGGLWKMT